MFLRKGRLPVWYPYTFIIIFYQIILTYYLTVYFVLKDVAISSPYEDNGKGSVYIYHGGPTELTFTQKIQAKDISNDLFSFGWYISAAYDIDRNNYSGKM